MNNMEEKTKISQFEFAIMSIADPEEANKHQPLTDAEALEKRVANLKRQASKIKVLKPKP